MYPSRSIRHDSKPQPQSHFNRDSNVPTQNLIVARYVTTLLYKHRELRLLHSTYK